MKRELKPERHYARVHVWLRAIYGKAHVCECNSCNGLSSSYDWALIHGNKYDYDRNNFIMLCRICHKKYDMTEQCMRKMSVAKTGSNNPRSILSETDVLFIRKNYDRTRSYVKTMSDKYKVSKPAIYHILKRETWKHI